MVPTLAGMQLLTNAVLLPYLATRAAEPRLPSEVAVEAPAAEPRLPSEMAVAAPAAAPAGLAAPTAAMPTESGIRAGAGAGAGGGARAGADSAVAAALAEPPGGVCVEDLGPFERLVGESRLLGPAAAAWGCARSA